MTKKEIEEANAIIAGVQDKMAEDARRGIHAKGRGMTRQEVAESNDIIARVQENMARGAHSASPPLEQSPPTPVRVPDPAPTPAPMPQPLPPAEPSPPDSSEPPVITVVTENPKWTRHAGNLSRRTSAELRQERERVQKEREIKALQDSAKDTMREIAQQELEKSMRERKEGKKVVVFNNVDEESKHGLREALDKILPDRRERRAEFERTMREVYKERDRRQHEKREHRRAEDEFRARARVENMQRHIERFPKVDDPNQPGQIRSDVSTDPLRAWGFRKYVTFRKWLRDTRRDFSETKNTSSSPEDQPLAIESGTPVRPLSEHAKSIGEKAAWEALQVSENPEILQKQAAREEMQGSNAMRQAAERRKREEKWLAIPKAERIRLRNEAAQAESGSFYRLEEDSPKYMRPERSPELKSEFLESPETSAEVNNEEETWWQTAKDWWKGPPRMLTEKEGLQSDYKNLVAWAFKKNLDTKEGFERRQAHREAARALGWRGRRVERKDPQALIEFAKWRMKENRRWDSLGFFEKMKERLKRIRWPS